MMAGSAILFLLQIRHVNPEAWRNLYTAVTMRSGSGIQSGSPGFAPPGAAHFGFGEWARRICQSLGQDYLLLTWVLVPGWARLLIRNLKSPGFRWIGWAVLQMGLAGIPYMFCCETGLTFTISPASFVWEPSQSSADWGSNLSGSASIVEACKRSCQSRGAPATLGLVVWLAVAGFARAEDQRSPFLILDGIVREPSNLIPDVGRYLARTFPEDGRQFFATSIPITVRYRTTQQRTIIPNLGTSAEWNAAVVGNGPEAARGNSLARRAFCPGNSRHASERSNRAR